MHNVTKVFPHEFLMVVIFLSVLCLCLHMWFVLRVYSIVLIVKINTWSTKVPIAYKGEKERVTKTFSTICSQQKHAKKIDDTSLYIMSVYPYIHTFYLNVPFHHQKWIYHNQITVYSQLRRMYIRAKANCKMKYQRPSKGKNKIVNKLLELCS